MSNTENNSLQVHRRLILTIASLTITVLLATTGWTFAVLRSQAERDAIRMEVKLDRIDMLLQDLLVKQAYEKSEMEHLRADVDSYRSDYEKELSSMHTKLNMFMGQTTGGASYE